MTIIKDFKQAVLIQYWGQVITFILGLVAMFALIRAALVL